MAEPVIQEGSYQYYAIELKISKPTAIKLGKEECAKRLHESRKIAKVVETQTLEICDSTETNSMIEELKDSFSRTNNDNQEFATAMESVNKRVQIEAVSYLSRFISGQLSKSEKDSTRANICLKFLKSFSKKPSTKSVKKASITNKTRMTKTLTTEVQEEKSLDLDNDV